MKRYVILLSLICTPALAQQGPSPVEQALSKKLSLEYTAGLQCIAGLFTAEARIKELEAQLAAATKPGDQKPKP